MLLRSVKEWIGFQGFLPFFFVISFFPSLLFSSLFVVAYKLGEEQFIKADELALIFDVEFDKLRVLIPSEEEEQLSLLTKNLRDRDFAQRIEIPNSSQL